MVVAPDLRDGRPPEEAEQKNVSYSFAVMLAFPILLSLFGWPAVPEVRRHYHPAILKLSRIMIFEGKGVYPDFGISPYSVW